MAIDSRNSQPTPAIAVSYGVAGGCLYNCGGTRVACEVRGHPNDIDEHPIHWNTVPLMSFGRTSVI